MRGLLLQLVRAALGEVRNHLVHDVLGLLPAAAGDARLHGQDDLQKGISSTAQGVWPF